MRTPKAIPTDYNGHEFRSRFEAEMAYVLDALGIAWEYEPKSFLLPGGYHYMPDFYLPDIRMWVECRGYKKRGSDEQIEAFAQSRPEGERVLRVYDKKLGEVSLWHKGKWVPAGINIQAGSYAIVPHSRSRHVAKIVATNSRIRFISKLSPRSLAIDDVLEAYKTSRVKNSPRKPVRV